MDFGKPANKPAAKGAAPRGAFDESTNNKENRVKPASFSVPSAAPDPVPLEESCGNHPGFKVRYHCQNEKCGFLGCSACVKLHVSKSTGKSTPWCWKCGERVIELQSAADVRADAGPPFYAELGKVFGYPFSPEGRYLFVALIFTWGVASIFTRIGTIVRILLVVYPLQVIRQTAKGVDHPPDFADIFDPDTQGRIFRTVLIYIAYYIPTIVMIFMAPNLEDELPLILLLLGLQMLALLLLPMGLAIMAEEDAWITAISPYHVGREILKVPKEYAILLALTLPMSLTRIVLENFGPGRGVSLMDPKFSGSQLLFGMGFKIVLNCVDFYFTVVQAHILGRIVRERRDVLHWSD
jgi:hypothetical protein